MFRPQLHEPSPNGQPVASATVIDNGELPVASNNRLLMVDDDVDLVGSVREYMALEGFELEAAHTYSSGLPAALAGDKELVVLDVMLPDGSGFDLLRELREQSVVPVLLLSGRGETADRVAGLELGADDYAQAI